MSQNTESDTVTIESGVTTTANDSSNITESTIEAVVEDLQEFEYFGVKFPKYFKNPRWVQTNDLSFTLAVDIDELTNEMRSNWSNHYLPELAALGKKVMQKMFKEKIPKL